MKDYSELEPPIWAYEEIGNAEPDFSREDLITPSPFEKRLEPQLLDFDCPIE
jgi:hypothetical protein